MSIFSTTLSRRIAAIAIGLSLSTGVPALAGDSSPSTESSKRAEGSMSGLTPEVLLAAAETVNERFSPGNGVKWAEVDSFADLDALEEASVVDFSDRATVSDIARRAGVDVVDISHAQWNVKRPGSAFDLIHGEAFTLAGADPADVFDAYVFTYKTREDAETFEEVEMGGKTVTAGTHLSGNSLVSKLRTFQLIGQGYVIYADGDTVLYIEGDPEATAAFMAELP